MDETERHDAPNPFVTASLLSKTFFSWLNPLFKKGSKGWLEEADLYNACKTDRSKFLGERLESAWEKQLKRKEQGKQPSLLKAFFRAFGLEYFILGLVVFVEEAIKFAQPVFLAQLLGYFTPDSSTSRTEAYIWAAALSFSSMVIAVIHHPYFFGAARLGGRVRISCCSLMFKKSLRLSNKSLNECSVGQIVNMMSNDVNRFDQGMTFFHFLWIAPIEIIASLVILWREVGPSVLAALAVVFLTIPVQILIGKLFAKLRRKTAAHTDKRVKVMNEIISAMRIIKMYCWEIPFRFVVEKLRSDEVSQLTRTRRIQAFIFGPYFATTQLSIFLLFLALTLLDEEEKMRPSSLFLTMGIIQNLRLTCGLFVPLASQNVGEARIVINRIESFLLKEELKPVTHDQKENGVSRKEKDGFTDNHGKKMQCGLELTGATAKWEGRESESDTLKNITLGVKANELVAVIGPVGSGKTSLLMSILRELPLKSGSLTVHGKVAYVSQQSWVFSGSVRQNILFGEPFDKARYDTIIKITALTKDLSILPKGDATLIGDRGVTLSGGQRARVSLARALYMDADIYLLDDPLAAVDTAVGRHIFEKCIVRYLKHKPRILVTHHVQLLPVADNIVILTEPEPVQLPDEEERRVGSLGYRVFVEYMKAGAGVIKFLVLLFFLVLAQCLFVASDWWLARWSNKAEDRHAALKEYPPGYNFSQASSSSNNNSTLPEIPDVDNYFNLYVLAGLIFALCISSLIRALLFFKVAVDAGKTLHNMMFARLLRTAIGFFDTNPVGRVLNRFSKDVGHVDDSLPWTMFDFLQTALLSLGIVVVAGIFNPWVFIPIVPLFIVFIIVRWYYLQTSRSVKRLEGTTRSPVFSYLSASLQGIHTIRAMHREERFSAEFDAHQDHHTSAWFLFITSSRWLGVRLDWLSVLFISCVAFFAVITADSLDAGFVGLSIVYCLDMMGLFQWCVRQSAEVENQMVSVERVLQYTQLPIEAALESKPDKKPPASWPVRGSIRARNVTLQYSSTAPKVLKNLNFDIRHAEKIGIVGRTGAGKSSLITTLFRMVEPQGTLLIDGVNIQHIGLHDLRGAISIIPQDPVLFTGSVRRNLDPFQEYSDEQIWRALDEVQLKERITANTEGLYFEVNEGGANFSAGQRQLMCLARAVLGHTRILIIDEATANVDPITDELIQHTIRHKFKDCTVLTIAHRLHTIIDSDRIMVLDAGEIVELDTPMALLSKGEGGAFYSMVEQMGKAELEHLTEVARSQQTLPHSSDDPLTNDAKPKLANGSSDANHAGEDGHPTETGNVNLAFLPETTKL